MKNNKSIKNFVRKVGSLKYFAKKILKKKYQESYSQCGEDILCDYIFKQLKIERPTYLDIGAFHPTNKSNTYLFYKKKSCGVCIEPDVELIKNFKKQRPRDLCINVGVSPNGEKDKKEFFLMSAKALNTFSKEDANRYQHYGTHKINKIIEVETLPINEIIKNNFIKTPNLLSIDIEGLELEVLKTFDFEKFRPEILCVETMSYSENGTEEKDNRIIEFMKNKKYLAHSDTYINTIFVDVKKWKNRINI